MFCFIHIEKAAGSTLHNLLKYNYPNYVSLYPWYYWSNDSEAIVSAKELKILEKFFPFKSSFGGHTLRAYLGYEEVLKKQISYFTFFREPISRYLSYYYYQNDKMGFERTIEEYLNETRFNNFMTVRIAGDSDLDKAKQIVSEKIKFIGLTEEFNKSLLLLNQKIFNNKFDMRYEKRNISNRSIVISIGDLTMDQQEKVIGNNQKDIELYSFAKELFLEQINNYNGDLLHDEKMFNESLKGFEYKKWRFNLIKFYKGWNRYIAEPFAHNLR